MKEKDYIKIELPLTEEASKELKAGDIVQLSGEVFTARDAAHKKLSELLKAGQPLPFDLNNAVIYYTGAIFKQSGELAGGEQKQPAESFLAQKSNPEVVSTSPTTSARMDAYTPLLLHNGLIAMIGKGARNEAVTEAIKAHGAVYFAAVGGAGAFYAARITSSRLVAFPELGSEAIYSFTLKDFPVITAVDSKGNSVYNKLL